MQIIEGEGVTKYFGGLGAVRNVDFYVNQGEVAGLIGPNGAGKTTLFNLITGAFAPTSGMIRFKGENITALKPYQISNRGIGRTFQPVRVFPAMSVFDNVLLGSLFGRSRNISAADARQETTRLLEFVGLAEKQQVPVEALTIGDQKLVEVARALATRPELLLLDETMAGLNPAEVAQAVELIRRLQNEGVTVFLVEHVMEAVMGISDRIIVLHHGEKIAEGTPEEIATSKTVIKVYLGE